MGPHTVMVTDGLYSRHLKDQHRCDQPWLHSLKCHSKPGQWVSMLSTRALEQAHLNWSSCHYCHYFTCAFPALTTQNVHHETHQVMRWVCQERICVLGGLRIFIYACCYVHDRCCCVIIDVMLPCQVCGYEEAPNLIWNVYILTPQHHWHYEHIALHQCLAGDTCLLLFSYNW